MHCHVDSHQLLHGWRFDLLSGHCDWLEEGDNAQLRVYVWDDMCFDFVTKDGKDEKLWLGLDELAGVKMVHGPEYVRGGVEQEQTMNPINRCASIPSV